MRPSGSRGRGGVCVISGGGGGGGDWKTACAAQIDGFLITFFKYGSPFHHAFIQMDVFSEI